MGFPGGAGVKKLPLGNAGLIPGLGRAPGEGNGNALQYTCLENSMHREAWQATVHGDAKELDTTECMHAHARTHACTYTHTHTHKGIGNFFSL